jgi:hypothetical protein
MKVSDYFGLLVRGIGLMSIFLGSWNLMYMLAVHYGMGTAEDKVAVYMSVGIFLGVLGSLLILFARAIVRLSFPAGKNDSESL